MRRRLFVVWLITSILTCALTSCSHSELTAQDRVADFDYLVNLIKDNYPFLEMKARLEGFDWLDHLDEFRNIVVNARNDRDFALAIRQVLLSLGDGHTDIADGGFVPYEAPKSQIPIPSTYGAALKKTADYWYHLTSGTNITNINQPSLDIVYVSGEYVVVDVSPELSSSCPVSLGSRIVAVDGVPVDDYVRSLRGVQRVHYDSFRNRVYLSPLPLPNGKTTLTLEDAQNRLCEVQIVGMVRQWKTRFQPPPWCPSATTDNLYAEIIDGSIGYLRIKSMAYADSTQLESELSFIEDFCDSTKSLPAVIIDIRGNVGGDDIVWQSLVKKMISSETCFTHAFCLRTGQYLSNLWDYLASNYSECIVSKDALPDTAPSEIRTDRFTPPIVSMQCLSPEPDSTRYTGRIFLLTDNRVYSAAEDFAAFCKATHWATIVGEPTGGGGLGLPPCTAVLPHSRMVIRFSSSMGLNPDYSANEESRTKPDYLVEQSYSDLMRYVSNGFSQTLDPSVDTVLRFCLELIRTSVNP